MFFPVRHDRPLRSTPWVTMAIIAVNIVVFAATARQVAEAVNLDLVDAVGNQALREAQWSVPSASVLKHYLWPVGGGFAWRQIASSAFLHADIWHLGFNMLFLWIFGGAVEDRLGKAGFLALYAGGAAASAGLFLATGPELPMIGASGAIAAVTGAFLVLFPQVRVKVVMFYFFINWFEVPATLVLLFYFGQDLFFFLKERAQEGGGSGVAHAAHLGGFALGFLLAAGLLATKILPREPQWDLLAMFQHWRRCQTFKSVSRNGGPWLADAARGMNGKEAGKSGAPAQTPLLMARREGVFHFVRKGQLQEASAAYAALLSDHPGQVLPEQVQHDVAAQLMQNGDHAAAAEAFRLLLSYYPRRADRAQTQLLLALLCARYLGRADEAQTLLKEALPSLEGAEKTMAEGLLAGK